MSSKLSLNIRTLLISCEDLAKDDCNHMRLKKYIKSLDTMIMELAEFDDLQTQTKLENFTHRLNNLKARVNYEGSSPITDKALKTDTELMKEMHQINAGHQNAFTRRELLESDSTTSLRFRGESGRMEDDKSKIPEAAKHYNVTQDKIAEHMMSLARNLKEQAETANRIIKSDTEVVSSSAGMADKNLTSLGKEGEKLRIHARNACKCWLWMMFAFVIVVFIGMILFMKIVKKRS